MASSPRSAAEWDEIFDRFLAADPPMTQQGFCEHHDIAFGAFRNRYRNSPKFAGRRRRPRHAPEGGFRPVAVRDTAPSSPGTTAVTIRLGEIAVDCPVGIGPDAIAAIARQLAGPVRAR